MAEVRLFYAVVKLIDMATFLMLSHAGNFLRGPGGQIIQMFQWKIAATVLPTVSLVNRVNWNCSDCC